MIALLGLDDKRAFRGVSLFFFFVLGGFCVRELIAACSARRWDMTSAGGLMGVRRGSMGWMSE